MIGGNKDFFTGGFFKKKTYGKQCTGNLSAAN